MVSITILVIGTIVFLQAGTIDYYTFIHAINLLIPAIAVIGGLSFFIGKIFESSNPSKVKSKRSRNNDLLIDDLLIDDVKNDELKDNNEV